MLKTTDSGINWIFLNSGTIYPLMSISFLDSQNGYIGGSGGIVIKTTNAGITWTIQRTVSNNTLYSIRMIDANTGYAVGDKGTILKTTNGGEPIGIRRPGTEVPEAFILKPNYPNPFNPSTSIGFDIPKKTIVKLIIYDITGREVISLLDAELTPGSYQITWNASGFASGIYFCKLEAGTFQAAQKMVLLK